MVNLQPLTVPLTEIHDPARLNPQTLRPSLCANRSREQLARIPPRDRGVRNGVSDRAGFAATIQSDAPNHRVIATTPTRSTPETTTLKLQRNVS